MTTPGPEGLEAVRGEAGTNHRQPRSFSSFLLPQSQRLLPETKPTTPVVRSFQDPLPFHEFSSFGSNVLSDTHCSVRSLDQRQRPPWEVFL